MKIIGLSVVVALGVLVVVGMGLTSHIFSYLRNTISLSGRGLASVAPHQQFGEELVGLSTVHLQ